MLPFIEITNELRLPSYGLMAIIGFVLALTVAFYIASVVRVHSYDVLYASIYAGLGLIIGAKIVYFITVIPTVADNWEMYSNDLMRLFFDGFSGFVFYGGLIGSLLGIYVYSRRQHMPVGPFFDIMVVAIPVMHGIGRIGCLMAGCCYGCEYHGPLSITFPENEIIPEVSGVERFPMQLIEIFFNLILFIVFFTLVKKRIFRNGRLLGVYLMAYPMMRFVLEFFRGDEIRGHFSGFSTSQWISLILFPIGCYIVFAKKNVFEKQ